MSGQSRSRSANLKDTVAVSQMPDLIEDFLCYCQIRRHSSRTIANRRRMLLRLLSWLESERKRECGFRELMQFFAGLSNLRTGGTLRASSMNGFYKITRVFFSYLKKEGVIGVSPMERIPVPRVNTDAIHVFEQEQFSRMLQVARKSIKSKRDAAILLFLMDTGVRAGELCALRLCDLDLKANRARVYGKGDKYRHVYFGIQTSSALRTYLREHPGKKAIDEGDERHDEDKVFLAWSGPATGRGLTRSGLWALINRLGELAGLQGVRCSPHTLRHTFATEFIRNEGNQQALQAQLGHSSAAQTQKYVHLAHADVRNEHRRASPVDRMMNR